MASGLRSSTLTLAALCTNTPEALRLCSGAQGPRRFVRAPPHRRITGRAPRTRGPCADVARTVVPRAIARTRLVESGSRRSWRFGTYTYLLPTYLPYSQK